MREHLPVATARAGRWLYATDYAHTAAKLRPGEALVLAVERDDLAVVCPDAATFARYAHVYFEAYAVPGHVLLAPLGAYPQEVKRGTV